MNTISKTVVVFVGLAVVFAVLIFLANNTVKALNQILLVSLGSAIFGSGLTFFLIRVSGLGSRK